MREKPPGEETDQSRELERRGPGNYLALAPATRSGTTNCTNYAPRIGGTVQNGFKKQLKRELYKRFLFIDGNDLRIMLYG